MSEHTPTPWAVMGNRGDIKSVCKGFPETMVAKALGQPTREERAANAAFIVKAVNNHQPLVDALAECMKALEGCYQVADWPADGTTRQDDAVRTAERTLASVSGPAGSGK